MIERNVEDNSLEDKIRVSNLEANSFLATHTAPKQRFDFIDIDPYGSPSPYMDTAIRALTNRGLIAVTATDTAPLCGVGETACVRKYWGKPLRTEYSKELAIRLILNSIVLTASRHDRGIEVLLTHATDHYFRAYVQIVRGALRSDASISQLGHVLHCFHCMNRILSRGFVHAFDAKCPLCGDLMRVAGPVWLGPLVDKNFCRSIVDGPEATEPRASKLLQALIEEADSAPCYFVADKVCDRFNLPIPPKNDILFELKKLGHQATGTHFHPTGIKTDASIQELKEILFNLARK
jgi:tRNA (guanine26-N2/guanine27-N2)-dimethyltransferase